MLPGERLILEITEHAQIPEYAALARALAPLRQRGVRLAVDDAGAGYASLRHILRLKPDLIKLDISLVKDIDKDSDKRVLALGLISFALQTKTKILAEGVETEAELLTLRSLGVGLAQGYFLGRPVPLADAMKLAAPAAH